MVIEILTIAALFAVLKKKYRFSYLQNSICFFPDLDTNCKHKENSYNKINGLVCHKNINSSSTKKNLSLKQKEGFTCYNACTSLLHSFEN